VVESQVLLLVTGVGAIAVAIAVAVLSLATASVGRSGVARALETIDRVYAPGSAAASQENLRDRAFVPAGQALGRLARLLTPKGAGAWLQRWLDYAGNPPAWPPERIMEMQGVGLFAVGALGGGMGLILGVELSTLIGMVAIGAVVGFWLPFAIVYDVGARRQDRIRKALPDAMDLLTVSVEAGMGFDAAVAQVAGAMPGPLAREFARMLQEMQMGQRRADALRAVASRSRVMELRSMSTAIVQATELGIPIAHVLREQAAEMRLRRRQRAEERAQKVPVKIIFPLVLCLFPALFIVVIGPGVINIMTSIFGR
jgi:tight adherence protein C